MNEALISVIVPVYKVESYLDYCIQSIVNQTYQKLEIILIDDGSPDNCPTICDTWAQKDSRIKVIHQKNSGGAYARNVGLDIASGEYISFIDSDDYISLDMFQYLAHLLDKGYDIAECGYISVNDNNVEFPRVPDQTCSYSTVDALREHIHDAYFRQLVWNKLYRKQVINDIRFTVGKKIDDEFFTYLVLGNANKLIQSNQVLYAYRQQEASVMHSTSVSQKFEAIEAKLRRHEYFKHYFPQLEPESAKSIWFTCLYHGQKVQNELLPADALPLMIKLEEMLQACPLERSYLKHYTNKERMWLFLAKHRFSDTCKVRNILGIGC